MYWVGLNSSTDQEAIRRGANALINVALESHAGTSFFFFFFFETGAKALSQSIN
jgi:hypothetical protein